MTTNVPDWDLAENGDIVAFPLMGWAILTAPMAAVARIEFVRSEEQLKAGENEGLQLALTGPQLRELADALLKTAEQIESLGSGRPAPAA